MKNEKPSIWVDTNPQATKKELKLWTFMLLFTIWGIYCELLPAPTNALTFVDFQGGSISREQPGDGSELIKNIRAQIRAGSASPVSPGQAGTKPQGGAGDKGKTANTTNRPNKSEINYDKLFHAVSMAESAGCTSSVAKRTNNCTSLMGWHKNGRRFIRKFESKEANKVAFIELWKRVYKTMPTAALAKKYTGNDSPSTWLKTVNQHYYEKKHL